MGVFDFFKRTGKPITADNLEAKAREVAAQISKKESAIAKLRAELPGQVLDGDNLAAHRIEHEEREIRALQVAQTELEAKARELRVFEDYSERISQWDVATEKGRECETLAKALMSAIAPVRAAAQTLRAANAEFVASVPMSRLNFENLAQRVSVDLGRMVALAVEDPDTFESAIASLVDLCVANAESLRDQRGNNEEPAPKQAKVG